MNIRLDNFFHHTVVLFKENIVLSLTNQQKKIIAIALLALTCLAICYHFIPRALEATEFSAKANNLNISPSEQIQKPNVPVHEPTIYFYNKGESYYELTNFYENYRKDGLHHVIYNGQAWKTSEHAFQAEKFNWNSPQAQNVQQQIMQAPTASAAFKIAQANKHLSRSDWQQNKDEIMLNILRCKFNDQHLSNVLYKTGTRYLVEASPIDSYWGYGSDEKGLNRLGILLMQVRKERFGF